MSQGGTIKSRLESVEKELKEEVDAWNAAGLLVNNWGHTNESIFALKCQVQTLVNLILRANMFSEDEINFEFKTLLLADMHKIRTEIIEPKLKEAEANRHRDDILKGIHIKMPWEK
jgi:hypothetical protein